MSLKSFTGRIDAVLIVFTSCSRGSSARISRHQSRATKLQAVEDDEDRSSAYLAGKISRREAQNRPSIDAGHAVLPLPLARAWAAATTP